MNSPYRTLCPSSIWSVHNIDGGSCNVASTRRPQGEYNAKALVWTRRPQMAVFKNKGPEYLPQMAGLLLEKHPQKGPPCYRNSQVGLHAKELDPARPVMQLSPSLVSLIWSVTGLLPKGSRQTFQTRLRRPADLWRKRQGLSRSTQAPSPPQPSRSRRSCPALP